MGSWPGDLELFVSSEFESSENNSAKLVKGHSHDKIQLLPRGGSIFLYLLPESFKAGIRELVV